MPKEYRLMQELMTRGDMKIGKYLWKSDDLTEILWKYYAKTKKEAE